MILSMTGYGNAVLPYKDKKIHVEIKSLNSKTLDLSVRIIPLYREKELEIRKIIAKNLNRGKIDLFIWIEKTNNSVTHLNINTEIIENYINQMKAISLKNKIDFQNSSNIWSALVSFPEIISSPKQEELTEDEWTILSQTLQLAIKKLYEFRMQEGKALYQDFIININKITKLLDDIKLYEKSRIIKIKERLEERLEELGFDYDKNRLEQELIYYIEKLDINEEKQRLLNHIIYFRKTLEKEPGQGKKLGFISQEMGREINTLGSKSNQAEMQNIVIKMKDSLEKIKEQILNVL